MPKVDFDPEEREGSPFDYPKLKLQMRERARINVIEKQPVVGFIHTLRAPEIVGGKVVMEMAKASRDSDELVPVPKMGFIGRPLCLGDYATLKDKGRDSENCPICAASEESDAVRAPERRFAIHVVQYATKENSFDIADPFSVSIRAWSFTSRIFDKLIEIKEEWGNLQAHDLKLGPCENAIFQKFDIEAAKISEWNATEERKKLTAATVKNNLCPDLEMFIGRKLDRATIESDLNRVLHRARQAAATMQTTVGDSVASDGVTDDVAEVLSDDEADVATAVEDLLEEKGSPEETTTEEAAPAEEGAKSEKPETEASFEDLLASIE